MMFTTTISVSSIYITSIIVIIPVIWLYIVVVVIIISSSVVDSWVFISLLFVWSGIRYIIVGDRTIAVIIILLVG